MNKVRNASFSGSWYPGTAKEIHQQMRIWDNKLESFNTIGISGIVPHAGWFFSGSMAYDVIRRIDRETDIVVVLGGHLPETSPILYYSEDSVETPCGKLQINRRFIDFISNELPSQMDIRADNTIEVQLPFIKALMGTVEIVPLRVPSGDKCLEIVPIIIEYAAINNLKIAVIGSTDLTHYGPNYNFEPESSLADPVEWVRKRDNKILQAMINNQVQEILNLSRIEYSACSAGAAACTSLFASLKNNSRGKLLKYDTSLSKHEADSFVGYGSIIYEN